MRDQMREGYKQNGSSSGAYTDFTKVM